MPRRKNGSFCSQGGIPHAGVVADASGNLYGATYLTGYAYELSLSGGQWIYTTLLQLFTGDGPVSNLTLRFPGRSLMELSQTEAYTRSVQS